MTISVGKTYVTIKPDGTIIYGDGYTPDAAAKAFWDAIGLERKERTAEQEDRGNDKKPRKNTNDFGVVGNSLFGAAVRAWRRATPVNMFISTVVLGLCSLGIAGTILFFFRAE